MPGYEQHKSEKYAADGVEVIGASPHVPHHRPVRPFDVASYDGHGKANEYKGFAAQNPGTADIGTA